jgi:hypothetical protein
MQILFVEREHQHEFSMAFESAPVHQCLGERIGSLSDTRGEQIWRTCGFGKCRSSNAGKSRSLRFAIHVDGLKP